MNDEDIANADFRIKLKKLPVWAQEAFNKIARERNRAIRALNCSVDLATPSHFYYEAVICTGESKAGGPSVKRFYVHAYEMIIEAFGVEVRVRPNDRENRIQISWSDTDNTSTDIAMIPTLQQTIELVSRDNMRDYRKNYEEEDLRDEFWTENEDLAQRFPVERYRGLRQNQCAADLRIAWCDFVERMVQEHRITEDFAKTVTL